MRRHWKKFALVLGGPAAACLLLALFGGEPEPSYGGRTLTEWIRLITPTETDRQAKREALLIMGTDALSCLAKWAAYSPPKWRTSTENLFHTIFPRARNRWYDPGRHRAWLASEGFYILGTNAYPALPELNELAATSQDPEAVNSVNASIYKILYSGIIDPDLRRTREEEAFHNPNPAVRQAATNAHFLLQASFRTNSSPLPIPTAAGQ